jgi:uncharacterized protein (DUF58 family)
MEQEKYKGLRQSRLQLFSRLKLKNIFPGEWESIYTGEGIEFTDIRPFEPGDDLRDLDLAALVRSGEEETILRATGRQMKVFVWADLSGSMLRSTEMFLSSKPRIRDIAIGLIIYSSLNAYNPVGLCAFDKEIRCFFPAKYGKTHCSKILERIIDEDYKDTRVSDDVQNAISFLMQKAYSQSMVFFVSDFKDPVFEEDFAHLLRPLAKKVDFIPVVIRDPVEKDASLKRPINIAVTDSEGGRSTEIYLTPKKLKEIQGISANHLLNLERNFRRAGVGHVVLDSPLVSDCFQVLSCFFKGRKRARV